MKSVSWETSTGALAAFLIGTTTAQLYMADLYTFTLNDGTVLRYTAADKQIVINGNTFLRDPVIIRGNLNVKVGVEVDTLDLTLYPNADSGGTLVEGVPIVQFIAGGGLDGARVQMERSFAQDSATAPVGTVLLFSGRVGAANCTRHYADLTVNSDLDLLNSMVPRNIYQSGCLNTLYDGSCKIDKAPLTISGTVSVGQSRNAFLTDLVQPDHWFDLGVVLFLTGQNAGQTRTVKRHNATFGGMLSTIYPLPFIPATNDTFKVYPGCDKTLDTCTSKFNNRIRFRGFKFIPIPETVT